MDRKSMKVVAVAMLSALCACAGAGREAKPERSSDSMGSEPGFQLLMVDAGGLHRFGNADARPDQGHPTDGSRIPILLAEAGGLLRFVNADARPHQIYSNDCSELSSTVMNPGDSYTATIGSGPKLCHFQDLLAPLATGYSGAVRVHDDENWLVLAGGG